MTSPNRWLQAARGWALLFFLARWPRVPEPKRWTTSHAMRAFIIFILSCAPVFGADSGIRVFTTAKTNAETGSISMKVIFTRDGQTNLVCTTKTKAGAVQIRIQRF